MSDLKDQIDVKKTVLEKTIAANTISVGITWVHGKIVFKDDKKWSKAYYAICHYRDSIWIITPADWNQAKMITTILVSPLEHYCQKAYVCLDFDCPLNKFNRKILEKEFDTGSFTLGLPQDIGRKTLWFNTWKYRQFWGNITKDTKPEGAILSYSEEKLKKWKEKNLIRS